MTPLLLIATLLPHSFFFLSNFNISDGFLSSKNYVNTKKIQSQHYESRSFSVSSSKFDPMIIELMESQLFLDKNNINKASEGIRIWKHALMKGRVPTIDSDFSNANWFWPSPLTLFDSMTRKVSELQLSRLTYRHPECIPMIVRSILRLTNDYHEQIDYDDDRENELIISKEITNNFYNEWTNIATGINLLDDMFGYDHEWLADVNEESSDSGQIGFGFEDGIWDHSGWKNIDELNEKIAKIPELRQMLQEVGRRPSAFENNKKYERFQPRKFDRQGIEAAEFDPYFQRESIEGLTLSGNLSDMLPTEAALFCQDQRLSTTSNDEKKSSANLLRKLFLAKLAEKKLQSYQYSSWFDTLSKPKFSNYKTRLPSAPGGPIIICLDTSWSMSGMRETLSKAVVLACVIHANKQGRNCQIISFSTERNVMESGIINAKEGGIRLLLEFLSHSFGGGTDVTGALKFAISIIANDDDCNSNGMEASDLILVTDGEIPGISEETLSQINRLKETKDLKLYGLLIGKSESHPLERICTYTYDFLSKYSSLPTTNLSRTRYLGSRTALYAKPFDYDIESTINGAPMINEEILKNLKSHASEKVKESLWKPEELIKERSKSLFTLEMKQRINLAVSTLEEGLVERGEESRLVVLACLSNEHILLLGKPGTAKSVLGLRLAKLCNGIFFQRLLTKFTTPDELFGPLSLKALEQDEYLRITQGYLPEAEIVFLDEIFKANSAILNTLLTLLNERTFDNGSARLKSPLRCVVGASNELPDSDELEALYDRFLLRKEVLPVSDEGIISLINLTNRLSCSDGAVNDDECAFNDFDYILKTLFSTVDSVAIDTDRQELLRNLRIYLRENNIYVSDRRLVKAARLLKICAACDGRLKVDSCDFLLLEHCFWNEPKQRLLIREWLIDNLTPSDGEANQLRFLLNNLRNDIIEGLKRNAKTLDALKSESEQIAMIAQQNLDSLARHTEILKQLNHYIWIDHDDALFWRQMLLPRAELLYPQLLKLVEDAKALELSISLDNKPLNNFQQRKNIIQSLWEEGELSVRKFTEDELSISMREAKSKYDLETFRRWKRIKKKEKKNGI